MVAGRIRVFPGDKYSLSRFTGSAARKHGRLLKIIRVRGGVSRFIADGPGEGQIRFKPWRIAPRRKEPKFRVTFPHLPS